MIDITLADALLIAIKGFVLGLIALKGFIFGLGLGVLASWVVDLARVLWDARK